MCEVPVLLSKGWVLPRPTSSKGVVLYRQPRFGYDNSKCRGVAQLAARLLWEQDAAGSNPVTPIYILTSMEKGGLRRDRLSERGSIPAVRVLTARMAMRSNGS